MRSPCCSFATPATASKMSASRVGRSFPELIAGRGLAMGDFDNDGSVDVLVAVSDSAPILLRNNAGRQNHWLGVRLIGRKSNLDAVGAKVTYRAGDFRGIATSLAVAAIWLPTIRVSCWASGSEPRWIGSK